MKTKALMIASFAATGVLAAGSAWAQSPGSGASGPSPMEAQGPHGSTPRMMQNMARGMGPCMGMMQHMGHGMMQGGTMQGAFDLAQIDPAQLAALKSELGITSTQETAWTNYSNVLGNAAATTRSTREAAKTAADDLLTALDEEQKAKARQILPGLASSGRGMMGDMTMGEHRQQH